MDLRVKPSMIVGAEINYILNGIPLSSQSMLVIKVHYPGALGSVGLCQDLFFGSRFCVLRHSLG